MSGIDPATTQPSGIGPGTGQQGHFDGANHVRFIGERGHRRQDRLPVSTGRLKAMVPGAPQHKGVDLIFRRPGEPLGQLPVSGEASLQSRDQTLPQAVLIVLVCHRRVAAQFDVRQTCLDRVPNRAFLGTGLVDQTHDGHHNESRRAGGAALRHLPFDHALKLVRSLDHPHAGLRPPLRQSVVRMSRGQAMSGAPWTGSTRGGCGRRPRMGLMRSPFEPARTRSGGGPPTVTETIVYLTTSANNAIIYL